MKVLEKGPGWSIKVKCTGNGNGGGGCSSMLLVEADDIEYISYTAWYGEKEYCYTVHCPVCKVSTDISESRIPEAVKSLCMARRL